MKIATSKATKMEASGEEILHVLIFFTWPGRIQNSSYAI